MYSVLDILVYLALLKVSLFIMVWRPAPTIAPFAAAPHAFLALKPFPPAICDSAEHPSQRRIIHSRMGKILTQYGVIIISRKAES